MISTKWTQMFLGQLLSKPSLKKKKGMTSNLERLTAGNLWPIVSNCVRTYVLFLLTAQLHSAHVPSHLAVHNNNRRYVF